MLETQLPYFGLTDLLTDDISLELSVITSPPLIKLYINIMLTNLEETL